MPLEFSSNFTQASSWANDWETLFYFEVGIFIFFSVLIFSLILYFAFKYRRRPGNEAPPPTKDHLPLEVTWTLVPAALCVVMFVWGAVLFIRNGLPPAAATEIFVVGKQWMWKIQYPDGRRDINELHVPVGVPIKLTMASEDVIHDFAIPAFRIKKDVVPGHYSTLWFTATKTGRYHLYCDQYCGTSHSSMVGWVTVMEPAQYARWLSGGAGSGGGRKSLADAGADLYKQYACITCHDTGRGPSFVGLYGSTVKLSSGQTVKADDAYIRESILNPSAKIAAGYTPIMPTFQGQLSEEQILQLTTYIKSLVKPEAEGRKAAKP
ncbi:MAG TPA: cytochrome c oxidase subunit II [Candidatus Acidoferrum sp.]|jgi:cytochrome c oxidase subunit 2